MKDLLILFQFALFVWTVYLTVRVAQHVDAWPF
jgi:hypothetical protein